MTSVRCHLSGSQPVCLEKVPLYQEGRGRLSILTIQSHFLQVANLSEFSFLFSLSLSSFKKEEWRPESVHPESGCQGDGNLSWCSSCHARGVTAATCVACRVLGHSARKLHAFYCWILVEVVCGHILNIVPENSAGFVAVWTRLNT